MDEYTFCEGCPFWDYISKSCTENNEEDCQYEE